MSEIKLAVELIRESHSLWDQNRLEDALAVLEKATHLAPELPDPWIDIAAIYRAKNPQHQNEHLELKALDADRRLIELGSQIPELIAEVAQAERRVSYHEGWIRHLKNHLEEYLGNQRERQELEQREHAEFQERKEREDTRKRNELQKKINELTRQQDEALATAKKEFYNSLTLREKRAIKKTPYMSGAFYPDSYHAQLASNLEQTILKLVEQRHMIGNSTPTDISAKTPASLPYENLVKERIERFDYYRYLGHVCPCCQVRLDDTPPS